MTVFTVDVSDHDWDRRGANMDWVTVKAAGINCMCARATYGDPKGINYTTWRFQDFMRGAKAAGIPLRGGYHNLIKGDQASINRQVDWLRSQLDLGQANWAMLDVERYTELIANDMWPRWDDVQQFHDRWHQVDSRKLAVYLPKWLYDGFYTTRPSLRNLDILVSSMYPNTTKEYFKDIYTNIGGDSGEGWRTPYGGRVPEIWQYTSSATVPGCTSTTDVNAFRGTYPELENLLLRKDAPMTVMDQPDRAYLFNASSIVGNVWQGSETATVRDTVDYNKTGTMALSLVTMIKTMGNDIKALNAKLDLLVNKDFVDENAIAQSVLAGLSAETIVNAIIAGVGPEVANDVVTLLASKLTGTTNA